MPDQRTPRWLIQLRFFLICSPVGIGLAILLAPVAVPILLGFGGGLLVVWYGVKLFTHFFVKLVDPEGYQAHQERGGDVFYDSIGAPLNNDSEETRLS